MDLSNCKRLYCSRFLLDLKFCPLQNSFAPLATHFELPILAGETLYPTAEHYIAAQLFRDVGRLEAAGHVSKIRSQNSLREYIRTVLADINENDVSDWRHTKMLSALKTATKMKFAQYAEMKALLVQTGNSILIETNENDLDWGVGMNYENLNKLMESEGLSVASVTFWLMHCDFKPGFLGANLTGRLLMTLRNEITEMHKQSLTSFDPDVHVCRVCSTPDQNSSPVIDEIAFFNAANSVLSFNHPSAFIVDGVLYNSVESYVQEMCVQLAKSNVKPKSVEKEIYDLYNKAIDANLRQNRFARDALVRSRNSLLVDVRQCNRNKGKSLSRRLALNLGAFYGNFQDFISYVDQTSLNSQILARWFLTEDVPMLKAIGKNRLGLLLMKYREFWTKEENRDYNLCATIDTDYVPTFLRSPAGDFDRNSFTVNGHFLEKKVLFLRSKEDLCTANSLSKYFYSLFTVDSVEFISLEHFYWFRRLQNVATRKFLRRLLSTNNSDCLREISENYLSSNTPVEDEGQISDAEILDEGVWAKVDQNSPIAAALVDDLSIIIDGEAYEMDTFRNHVERWRIPHSLVAKWFLTRTYPKPKWLPDNFHGLSLMKVRQQLINKYYASKLPSNEEVMVTGESDAVKSVAGKVDESRFYIFTEEDFLSLRSNYTCFTFDGVEYASVIHFVLAKFFEDRQMAENAKRILDAEDIFSCESVTHEILHSSNLFNDFLQWRTTDEERYVDQALRCCLYVNEKFRQELMATYPLVLIYSSENEKFGVGLDKKDFLQFVNDVNLTPESFLRLAADDECKPKCMGRNLWAKLLTEARSSLFEKSMNTEFGAITCHDCVFDLNNLTTMNTKFEFLNNYEEEERKTNPLLRCAACSWETLSVPFESTSRKTTLDQQTLFGNFADTDTLELLLDKKQMACLSAFRNCASCFADLSNLVNDEEEARQIAVLLAQTTQEIFGDNLEQATKIFTFEDLNTLGRIVGYHQRVRNS